MNLQRWWSALKRRWSRRFHDPDAADALCNANQRLATANANTHEVQKIVTALRAQGETNHFIERLNMHLRGTDGPHQ